MNGHPKVAKIQDIRYYARYANGVLDLFYYTRLSVAYAIVISTPRLSLAIYKRQLNNLRG